MKLNQNIKVAVDAIVFGYAKGNLQVLLVKQKFGQLKNSWALVGGFVNDNEGLRTAAQRELQEEAGVSVSYMEQLYTFGDNLERDPRARVISVAYFALVNSTAHILVADTDAIDAKWFQISALPPLAYDHSQIIEVAISRLRNKLSYEPIGFNMLPPKFLFSELELLYATILNKNLDRRNFRKKVLSLGILEETDDFGPKSSGRPAKLFRFNKLKYNKLLKDGFYFEIKFA